MWLSGVWLSCLRMITSFIMRKNRGRKRGNDLIRPAPSDHQTDRARHGIDRHPPAAGADRGHGRASELALCRILHGQHPQPEHKAGLCARVRPVFCMVRRSGADARHDQAVRCGGLGGRLAATPFGTRREAAARRRADAVRLAHYRPGGSA